MTGLYFNGEQEDTNKCFHDMHMVNRGMLAGPLYGSIIVAHIAFGTGFDEPTLGCWEYSCK